MPKVLILLHPYAHALTLLHIHTSLHSYTPTIIHSYIPTSLHLYTFIEIEVHSYIHTSFLYPCTFIHPYNISTLTHPYIHAFICTHALIHSYIHTHSCIHTFMLLYIHTYLHSHIHSFVLCTFVYIHPYTHTLIRTPHIHTLFHAFQQSCINIFTLLFEYMKYE